MALASGKTISPRDVGKRAFDIAFSLAALAATAPAFVLVALLVSRDGGRVFHVDPRPGRGGRPFGCIKFRTMHMDAAARLEDVLAADPAARAEFARTAKLRDDPRVTPVGRVLRRASLDELPQFLNCLRGEMSVVGPRPRTMREFERARHHGPAFAEAFAVRPGVTGPWQISGRSRLDYADRVRIDADYARGWTLPGDLGIVLRTVPAVLRRDGAA